MTGSAADLWKRTTTKALLAVTALAIAAAATGVSTASAATASDLPAVSASGIPDVTEMWSSPGAAWIARQLRQVEPRWGIVAADLDLLALEWCSNYTPSAIARLTGALPGADLRALPALMQLVRELRFYCYSQGRYSAAEIDYWTYVTAGSLMTLVRANVRGQSRAASTTWKQPAPALPVKVSRSIRPAVPIACRAIGGIASSWLARAALKGPWGWAALAALSVAKAGCPTLLNAAVSRLL